MAQERIIPQGFSDLELPLTDVTVLIPDGWYFNQRAINALCRAYFVSREDFDAETFIIDRHLSVVYTKEKNISLFTTGLSVFFYWEVSSYFSMKSAAQAAEYIVEQTHDFRKVLGDYQVFREGDLTTYRRHFVRSDGRFHQLKVDAKRFYCEATANEEDQTLFVATFETPTLLWEQEEELAKTLVEGRIFEPLD